MLCNIAFHSKNTTIFRKFSGNFPGKLPGKVFTNFRNLENFLEISPKFSSGCLNFTLIKNLIFALYQRVYIKPTPGIFREFSSNFDVFPKRSIFRKTFWESAAKYSPSNYGYVTDIHYSFYFCILPDYMILLLHNRVYT